MTHLIIDVNALTPHLPDYDPDNDPDAAFIDTMTNMTPQFAMWVRDHGLYLNDARTMVHVDTDQLPTIATMCHKLHDELDHPNDPMTNWRRFNMHGDDDVDYNASYLLWAIETIHNYLQPRTDVV